MKSLVSIIVPIYNTAQFLDVLINSVLNQTFTDFTLILVNDGSTDKSLDIIKKYTYDKRVCVINQKNQGVSAARNNGLKISDSKYIFFIDGDDWIDLNCLNIFVNIAETTNCDLVMRSSYFTNIDTKKTNNLNCENIDGYAAASLMLYDKIGIGCWGMLYKNEVIKKNNILFDEQHIGGEGMRFYCEYCTKIENVVKVNEKYYYYRINNSSSYTTVSNVGMCKNSLYNTYEIDKLSKNKEFRKSVQYHLWKNNYYLLRSIFKHHEYKNNLKVMISCLLHIKLYCILLIFSEAKRNYSKKKILLKSIFTIIYSIRESKLR